MEKQFEYRGDLAETPLAEVLATIYRYNVPGILSVAREGRVRQIHLDEGLVIYASSNERESNLGMYLLRQGILKPEAAREAEQRRKRERMRFGQVLLQMGLVTPERLNEAILGQVKEILWGAFEWETGDMVFDVGGRHVGELVRIDLPIPEAILQGIRRAADVKRLVQRLGASTTVFEKTPGPLLDLFTAEERRFYEAVDGKTPLQPLCARGPASVSENARLLYAFFCLGLLRRMRGTGKGAKKIQYKTEGGSLGG